MDGKLISPERTEAERNLTSHCEKQSANHKPAYDQVRARAVAGHLPLGSSSSCPRAPLEGWQGAGGPCGPCELSVSCHNRGWQSVRPVRYPVCCWSASPLTGFKISQQKKEKHPV